MPGEQKNKNLSVYGQMTCAALAGCTADIFTFPLDTVKVWLQVSCFICNKVKVVFFIE